MEVWGALTSSSFFLAPPSTLYSLLLRQLLTRYIWIIGSDELERVPSLDQAEKECTMWVKHSSQSTQGEELGFLQWHPYQSLLYHFLIIIIIVITQKLTYYWNLQHKSQVYFYLFCAVIILTNVNDLDFCMGFEESQHAHIRMQQSALFCACYMKKVVFEVL